MHGSPLRPPFRNFSANQRLKHWSYSRFSSVHASPTLFISGDTRRNLDQEAKCGRVPMLFKSAAPRTPCVSLRAGKIYKIRGITLEEISDIYGTRHFKSTKGNPVRIFPRQEMKHILSTENKNKPANFKPI